jgi:hypothetical protein
MAGLWIRIHEHSNKDPEDPSGSRFAGQVEKLSPVGRNYKCKDRKKER